MYEALGFTFSTIQAKSGSSVPILPALSREAGRLGVQNQPQLLETLPQLKARARARARARVMNFLRGPSGLFQSDAEFHVFTAVAVVHTTLHFSNPTNWAGDVAQWLRALGVFTEDPGSIPNTYMTTYEN